MNIISDVKKFLLYRYKEKLKSNKLDELNFVSGGFLTIGAEVEIQLQDSKNLSLIPKALEILEKTNKLPRGKPRGISLGQALHVQNLLYLGC